MGWVGLDWIGFGLTVLVARSAVQVQAIPHSPARPNVLCSITPGEGWGLATVTLTPRCRHVRIRCFGGHWAWAWTLPLAHATCCVCTHAHAPVCTRPGRDEEKAEHRRLEGGVETASSSPRSDRIGPGQLKLRSAQIRTGPAVRRFLLGLCRWPGPVALHLQAGRQAARSTFHPDRETGLAANGVWPEAAGSGSGSRLLELFFGPALVQSHPTGKLRGCEAT